MRFLRLGVSGMHGVVGAALTPDNALRYALALATWIESEHPRIAIATDSRFSSPMLKAACLSGLLSTGADVIDYGICPAPVLQYAVQNNGLSGALLIGAGHHPAGWNAIVPVSADGACLTPSESQELLDIYHSGMYKTAPWNALGQTEKADIPEALEAYLDMLSTFIDVQAVADARFKVIVDFCNGSGAVAAEAFAKCFGIELVSMNNKMSGVLPHEAEPRPRSSVQVSSLIPYLHADAGFVLNSDAGRIAVVTDSGETLSEEYSFPLAAKHLLSLSPEGSHVVTNCCTTRTLDDIIARSGGILHRSKVGQSYCIDKMVETSAVIAGDGSGSVAVSGGVPAFDAFAVMALILESMAFSRKKLSQIAAELPRYDIIKTSIPCPSVHAYSLLHSLHDKFPDARISEEDGLRFDWPDGWIHLRASMTEPIIRLIVEWKGREEAEKRVMHTRSVIERVLAP